MGVIFHWQEPGTQVHLGSLAWARQGTLSQDATASTCHQPQAYRSVSLSSGIHTGQLGSIYNLKHACTIMYTFAERNQPAQVRSSREGMVWNCSKVALLAMSQLASHYGFMSSRHDWHDGNLSAYSNFMAQKTNELQTALSIQMTQSFVPRFHPPEGWQHYHLSHHHVGVSTGGRLAQLLVKSERIAKTLPWLDVMNVIKLQYNCIIHYASQHHSWCTWG